jgi:hypothetical protein
MEINKQWKTKMLVIGGILGLISGIIAAYLIVQRAEQEQAKPSLSAGDGVKVGLGVLGVLRLISDMGTKR